MRGALSRCCLAKDDRKSPDAASAALWYGSMRRQPSRKPPARSQECFAMTSPASLDHGVFRFRETSP